jgi:FkbM family methyltransferase
MSTSYFAFSKSKFSKIDDNADNQLVYLNSRNIFLLPEVNIDYYAKYGLFESQLIDWCKQFCKKSRVFLDIGAHTGTYTISLAEHCSEVYSFEPQRSTFYALCGGVALSNLKNVICCNVGLGSPSQTGTRTLHIVSADGGGSTIHEPADGVLKTETIEIRTLDSYGIKNVGFIKMDVEENELFVLQGAAQTLAQSDYPAIVFESNMDNNTDLFAYITNTLQYTVIKITGCVNMYLAVRQ